MAVPPWVTQHSFHLYILRLDPDLFGIPRADFLSALQAEGIPCSSGYAHPLYRNPLFLENQFHANGAPLSPRERHIDFSRYIDLCPVAEQACEQAIWIEHRVLLDENVEDISKAIQKIHAHKQEFQTLHAK